MFTCLEMTWNSYRGRFHIGCFGQFQIQHPIRIALRLLVIQVCAWKHVKVTHFNDFFSYSLAACKWKVFSYLLMSFCHFVFRMVFFQKLLKIDFKNSRTSGSQIFFKIGVPKNFTLSTRKHLCWSCEGWRPVAL